MYILKPAKKFAVLNALVEGCSIRSTSRLTGVHKTTILKLLVEVGGICAIMLDEQIHSMRCEAIECDEIWTFVAKKERRLTIEDRVHHPEYGDQYVFVAFDPESKPVPSFVVGRRDGETAHDFLQDLRRRVTGCIQLSTDGFAPYIDAVEHAFGMDVDYAQIIKIYEAGEPGMGRYSPPRVTDAVVKPIAGMPREDRICTSYVVITNFFTPSRREDCAVARLVVS